MQSAVAFNGCQYLETTAISGRVHVTRVEATIDGVVGTVCNDEVKDVPLLSIPFWVLILPDVYQKTLQVLLGRWMRALEYTRASFSAVNLTWRARECASTTLSSGVAGELLSSCCLIPVMVANIRPERTRCITASVASKQGGGNCESVGM